MLASLPRAPVRLVAALVLIQPFAAGAQSLTGLCLDTGSPGCLPRSLPFDGMTIDFCEETCTLTAPVSVRDMAGTLFDLQCRSDHGDSLRRVLLLEQTDHDGTRRLSWIDTQETRAIVPCP